MSGITSPQQKQPSPFFDLHCKKCEQKTRHELVKKITQSNAEFFCLTCLACDGITDSSKGKWIAKDEIIAKGHDLDSLRIIGIADQPRCAVCGSRGAELHHWAPKAIFGDVVAERWPKDYLCVAHHRQWHDTATPNISEVRD